VFGRTGRAGRSGDAILFITAHERDKVTALERAVGQTIEPMKMASSAVLNAARIARFKAALSQVMADGSHEMFLPIVQAYAREHGASGTDMAAAILSLAQEGVPLILEQRSGGKQAVSARPDVSVSADQSPTDPSRGTLDGADASHRSPAAQGIDDDVEHTTPSAVQPESAVAFKAYRIEVGHTSGIKATNLRDALARECRIEARFIGRLQMFDIFSLVELPGDLPNKRLKHLVSARVAGKPLQIRPTDELPQALRPEAN
jgi:ATP-dependent RNA helicase DeaD